MIGGSVPISASPLHFAIYAANLEEVKLLTKEGSLELVDLLGYVPLHHAVFKGDSRILTFFLESGANPNTREVSTGGTALHFAIARKDIDIIKLLLRYGADLFLKDNAGTCVAALIEQADRFDTIAQFKPYLLMVCGQALKNNNQGKLKDCVKSIPKNLFFSMLLEEKLSFELGMRLIVELVQNGVSLHEKIYRGNTALHFAVLLGNPKLIVIVMIGFLANGVAP